MTKLNIMCSSLNSKYSLSVFLVNVLVLSHFNLLWYHLQHFDLMFELWTRLHLVFGAKCSLWVQISGPRSKLKQFKSNNCIVTFEKSQISKYIKYRNTDARHPDISNLIIEHFQTQLLHHYNWYQYHVLSFS